MAVRCLGVSDLHLSANARPFAQHNLEIKEIGHDTPSAKDSERINTILLTSDQKQEFKATGDLDLALAFNDQNRCRVNLLTHKDGVAGTYRMESLKRRSA